MGRSIGSFVLAATPEGRSTAAGCTLESGRLLSGHMYLGGAGAKCKRATLLAAAAAHGCSREACGEGKQSRHAPFLSNLAAQILGLVEPGELHLQWAASSLGAGAPAQPPPRPAPPRPAPPRPTLPRPAPRHRCHRLHGACQIEPQVCACVWWLEGGGRGGPKAVRAGRRYSSELLQPQRRRGDGTPDGRVRLLERGAGLERWRRPRQARRPSGAGGRAGWRASECVGGGMTGGVRGVGGCACGGGCCSGASRGRGGRVRASKPAASAAAPRSWYRPHACRCQTKGANGLGVSNQSVSRFCGASLVARLRGCPLLPWALFAGGPVQRCRPAVALLNLRTAPIVEAVATVLPVRALRSDCLRT
jgi:hypothetical protein